MSLSANTRYRTVTVAWTNNAAAGGETAQIWVKPSGGSWTLASTVAVSGASQSASWATALPVTVYDVAVRYMNGPTPAVGYEGDPDSWTSPHSAGSKATVTTTAEAPTGLVGTFGPISNTCLFSWSCAQTSCTFKLEKSTDGGFSWSTVATDLAVASYTYTPAGGELNTTVKFRARVSAAGVDGPVSATLDKYLAEAPTGLVGTFGPISNTCLFSWSCAQTSCTFKLEKSTDGGFSWSTVATDLAVASYTYTPAGGELNTTVKFRARVSAAGVDGPVSATLDKYLGVRIGTPVVEWANFGTDVSPRAPFAYVSWTKATADDRATVVQCRNPVALGGQTSATVTLAAPAVGDVPANADGFKPVQAVACSWFVEGTGAGLEVRVGIEESGSIYWGAWQASTFNAASGGTTVVPTTSYDALDNTKVVCHLTVNGSAPGCGQLFYQTDVTQPLGWGMMLERIPAGFSGTKTMYFPTDWRTKTLYANAYQQGWLTAPNYVAYGPMYKDKNLSLGAIPS